MGKVNRSWAALIVAVLLLGVLVGVVWARPSDRPGAADITRKVTLVGADFIPTSDLHEYWAGYGYVRCVSGNCDFNATVTFPCLPAVTVERIKLHVQDANDPAVATADLYREHPSTKSYVLIGTASSPSGTAAFQTYTSDPINKVVWPSQRAYVHLKIWGTAIYVYGVTVEYHRNI